MDKDISLALESVSSVLKDRGFSKEAAVVEAVKAVESVESADARFTRDRAYFPPRPNIYPQGVSDSAPKNIGESLELYPSGKHKSIKSLEEIKRSVRTMSPKAIEEEYRLNDDPEVKKFLLKVLGADKSLSDIGVVTPENMNQQIRYNTNPGVRDHFLVRRQVMQDKLSSLGQSLTDRGYEALGRRLFEAAGRLYIA
jgi:hypothetical protein